VVKIKIAFDVNLKIYVLINYRVRSEQIYYSQLFIHVVLAKN